jgi:CelD/BcsL family acetyltransferase involved in cellulose biosynthesis
MPWQLHPAKSAFPRFAGEWDRLNAELYGGHPYFDSRFVGALLEHFGSGNERLCLHIDQGTVTGALILEPRRWGRWASFRPAQAQVTAILLADARLLKPLFGALPGFVWSIELNAIDPRFSPNLATAEIDAIAFGQAYTIGVAAGLRFDEYWNARPKNLKANIRRYFNRLEKEFAPPTLTRASESESMKDGVARFGTLESAGWKGAAGTAVSADNAQGAFYTDVLQRFAATGQAAIYHLEVAGQTVASRLIIDCPTMSVILKTTYDEAFARIAPGRIQLYRLIEDQLTHRPQQTIEFYTNATRDQKEWATFGCAIDNIQLFRNPAIAGGFIALKSLLNKFRQNSFPKNLPDGLTIGSHPDIAALHAAGLIDNSFSASEDIDATPAWFDILQNTVYPGDEGVRYHYATDGKETTLLPLRFSKAGRIRTLESLGNFYTALYAPLQTAGSDGHAIGHLLASAIKEHGGAHVMRFAPLDCNSFSYQQFLNELRAIGWVPLTYHCFGNWFLEVKNGWEGYLRSRSANLRSTIKRRSKDFVAAGGTLEVISGCENIEQAIAAFQEVYSASWKVPEPYPDFVPTLIRRMAGKGMLRLGIARLGDQAVAAQLWIVAGRKASIFKLAYHENYADYSPGTVLTAHLLRHVIERDCVTEVDFLKGDDKYKRMWMSHRRERRGIVAYNPATITGAMLLLKELLGRLTKCLRKSGESR